MSFLSDLLEPFRTAGAAWPRYAGISLATVAAVLVFEAVYQGWENSALRRLAVRPSPSAKMDLALGSMYALNLTPALAVVFSFGLGALAPISAKRWFGYDWLNGIGNPWLQAAAYALIYDFFWYWKHRISHRVQWWWKIHELHHSAREMNMITSNRLHPLDEALTRIFTCLPMAMAGAPPETYLWIRVVLLAHILLLHSNLPWSWGWIGRFLVVSPAVHRIHHSDLEAHRNRNFGNHIVLWDRLFGTWYGGNDACRIVGRPGFNRDAWYADVWRSYAGFWREVSRAVAPRRRAED